MIEPQLPNVAGRRMEPDRHGAFPAGWHGRGMELQQAGEVWRQGPWGRETQDPSTGFLPGGQGRLVSGAAHPSRQACLSHPTLPILQVSGSSAATPMSLTTTSFPSVGGQDITLGT